MTVGDILHLQASPTKNDSEKKALLTNHPADNTVWSARSDFEKVVVCFSPFEPPAFCSLVDLILNPEPQWERSVCDAQEADGAGDSGSD